MAEIREVRTAASMTEEPAFDDEYIREMAGLILKSTEDIQGFTDEYIRLMKNVRAGGITLGETADAIERFNAIAVTLKNDIKGFGVETSNMAKKFLSTVDEMDKKFF